jgi:long-subunit fatty acid transport protein
VSQWVLGGAATAGFAYFFAPSWVLDVSYAYAWTKAQTSNYLGSYSNASGKLIQAGTLIGQSTGQVNTQTFTASINWVFASGLY